MDSIQKTKAVELSCKIKLSITATQQGLYEMCMGFKEMRDSGLFKELGYSSFEEYCEKEIGFSRRNVYRYISIVENLPKPTVTALSQVGAGKLQLISRLTEDERIELTENTDFSATSYRELESKISAIKAERKKISEENLELQAKITELEKLSAEMQPPKYSSVEEAIRVIERENIRRNEEHDAWDQETTRSIWQKAEEEKQLALKELAAKIEEQKRVDVTFQRYCEDVQTALKRLADFTNSNADFRPKVIEMLERWGINLSEAV